ncbi:hypothetical protein [Rickettsia endosymbiont of Aspidapion aeneum]
MITVGYILYPIASCIRGRCCMAQIFDVILAKGGNPDFFLSC